MVGEFVNNRSVAVGVTASGPGAAVMVHLKNAGGATLVSAEGFAYLLAIAPGADSPFEAVFDGSPAFASLDIVVTACDTGLSLFPPATGLSTVTSSVGGTDPKVVAGSVQNVSGGLDFYTAVVAIYGADGNVARVGIGDVTPRPLSAGATGSFSVPVPDSGGVTPASHRVWYDRG